MADIPNQLRAIKVNGSKLDKDLALLDAADTIAAQKARIGELEADANKWRALVGCDRIRTIGRTLDYNHLGIELWNEHSAKHPCSEYPQDACREHLEKFVAKALSSNGGSDNG